MTTIISKIYKFKILLLLCCLILFLTTGCFPVETTNIYNRKLTSVKSVSKPVYLSVPNTKKTTFYFILSYNSRDCLYRIHVHWRNPKSKELLFDGRNSTLKFLVDNKKLLKFYPEKHPRVTKYDLDSNGHEEEAVFVLNNKEFYLLAEAKNVDVELSGRYITIHAKFNVRNTKKAFQDFAKECN
ncbi:MAG: hypothetical protein HRU35_07770 [Rickettsiaceae bacterium]|nr:hypothetical protein [Rickettsiaceae bacterium]